MIGTSRNILTKGLFAVGVVAITAIVGSVGFAQAQIGGRGAGEGYNGNAGLIQAAVAEFQGSVASAQSKLTSDINACTAAYVPTASASRNALNQSNIAAVNSLRNVAANPSLANQTNAQAQTRLLNAQNQMTARLDSNALEFYAQLDRNQLRADRQALRQCLRNATSSFRSSVQTARQLLTTTLRDILGRRNS